MKFDFSREAEKTIGKMDAKMAGRIFKGIMGLPNKGDIEPLEGKHAGQFRLRIGDWRIMYTIENNIILIGRILPRGDVYK